ncbi:MAG: hypothetical protein R2795_22500 [Saprospiraceae bacterium]
MHDGSMPTLEAVVAHYNAGGQDHPHKSTLVRPLQLTQGEQAALVAFLHSLTDSVFISNLSFQP